MKKIILILTLILLSTSLLAENHMDLIYEFEGENPGDKFGKSMCSLDFNGDGLDDLVVGSPEYNPSGVGRSYGRVYFYFGGDNFGETPDLIMTGNEDNLLDLQLRNLGDLNNDGCDDIGIPNYNDNGIPTCDETWILLGGAEPDTIPDYIYHLPVQSSGSMPRFNALGDVNNDGYDDAGISDLNQYYILWGGDTLELELFYEDINIRTAIDIAGIGDVNNDSYDDIQIGFTYDYVQGHYYYRNLLFYGGNPLDSIPDVVLVDTLYNCCVGGRPAGDWNNDGYDDFYSNIGTSVGFWLGGEEIISQPDIYLDNGDKFVASGGCNYGDFNNDGYSDTSFGSPGWAWFDGRVHIVLGGPILNGSTDLYINAPVIFIALGASIAVGDFNNDGFDDVAAGAPGTDSSPDIYPGKVYIYAGNDSLEETSVGVDDPDWPGEITNYEFMNVYPNPFTGEINFEIKAQYLTNLHVEIYNVKGQLVETINVKNRSFVWKAKEKASGVYFCKLLYKNEILEVKKVTLVK
jgi:hypothetical protein